MLASLTIKNIVLIDQLTIDFQSGLSALTGETGAGKSILLDSLGLALGARADAGLVRHGEEQASVIASFELTADHPASRLLQSNDLEFDPDLIIRRTLTSEGRSKAYINDQPVSINLLKQVGQMFVEIHGQFDSHALLDSQNHIALLDEYGELQKDLESLKGVWKAWKQSRKDLDSARERMEKARQEEEYLKTSLEDLDGLSPEAGEEEKLTSLRDFLMRREQIASNLQSAEAGLSDIEAVAGTVWQSLERLGDKGKEASSAMDRVNAELQEVVSALADISDDLENSEYSLEEIDDRLHDLKAQARKHGCSIDELSAKREEIAQALNLIENEDQALADLMQKVEQNKKEYVNSAEKISDKRKKISTKLAKKIMGELPPLKLEKVRFEVSIETMNEDHWGEKGLDQVQFLVATNPGSEPGPLNKVASGGELSRLMLALKVVLAEVGLAETLVFDEVDSGIGGATAAAVGERLARLAEHRQILVVTHSPQVAAMAQNHWIVSKGGTSKVKTDITKLNKSQDRQEEIARMLSGAEITSEARAAALKLLESGNIEKSAA